MSKHSPKRKNDSKNNSITKNNYFQIYWLYIILFLGACIPYLNAIPNEYALDDAIVFTSNQYVLNGFSGIKDILTNDTFSGFFGRESTALAGGRYRPLSLITFAIEYDLFGRAPHISHFINILLYAISGIFLFKVLMLWFKNYNLLFSFSIAILYITHPVHTEVVSNIKGRDEILSFLFILLSIYFLYKTILSFSLFNYLVSVVCFLISLFSKENAVTFIVIIPLILYFFTDVEWRKYTLYLSGFVVVTGVFLLIRQIYAAGTGAEVTEILNNSFAGASFIRKYSSIADIMNRYFYLLLIPYPLSFDYSYNQIPLVDFLSWRAIAGFIVNISLITYAILRFRKKDLISFSILYYYITISIVSNVFIPVGTSMSERFLYIPSLAFSMAVVLLLFRIFKFNLENKIFNIYKNTKYSIIIVLIIIFYSSVTIGRNPYWENNFKLFTKDVEVVPNSVKALIGAGGEYIARANTQSDLRAKNNDLQSAVKYLKNAVEIYPAYSNAWMLIGNAYFSMYSNTDSAIFYYDKALKANPDYADAYYNKGYLLVGKNDREAIVNLKKVLSINPGHFESAYQLGVCYKNLQLPDSAVAILEKAKMKRLNSVKVYQLLGLIYGESDKLDEAILNLSKAVELSPDDVENYLNLGIAYGKLGKSEEALKVLQRANELHSGHSGVLMSIGITYQNMGDNTNANLYFEKAFKINPSLRR